MISAADLASMQATVNSAFDQTATLQRPTMTPDATGHMSQSLAIVTINATGTAYNCNLATPSANLAQKYADRIGTLKAYKIRLPVNQDVKEQDILTITTLSNLALRVQAVLETNSYNTSTQALATVIP